MASQGLMCVWQALSSCHPGLRDTAPKEALRTLTAHFAHLRRMKTDPESAFCDAFLDDDVTDYAITLEEYSAFVAGTLRNPAYAMWLLEDDIEHVCWDLCAKDLEEQGYEASETLKQLWQIFGRLCERGSLPPAMPRGEVDWLVKKLRIGANALGVDPVPIRGPQSFEGLLDLLNFRTLSGQVAMQKAVDGVHAWLVKEVLKSGFMWKRTRKQKDWTDWRKRWFVLTHDQLAYYDGPKLKERKSALQIDASATLCELPDTRRFHWRLTGCFGLSWSRPFLQLEMSAMDEAEKGAWVSALREVQEAAEVGSTPVRRALSRRPRGDSKVNFLAEVLRALPFVKPDVGLLRPATRRRRDMHVLNRDSDSDTSTQCTCHRAVKKRTKPSVKEPTRRAQRLQSIPEDQRERIRRIFYSIDKDGNGWIDGDEFAQFLKELGLEMAKAEVEQIFEKIPEKQDGRITMEGFYGYFVRTILHETSSTCEEARLRAAFLNADRDQSGTINFREFVEYVWEKRRSIRISRVLTTFAKMDKTTCGEVKYRDFIEVMRHDLSLNGDAHPVPLFPSAVATKQDVLREEDGHNNSSCTDDSSDDHNNNNNSRQMNKLRGKDSDTDTGSNASTTVAADSEDTEDMRISSDGSDPDADAPTPEDLLRVLYEDADSDDPTALIGYLRTRWVTFSSFKRPGASGKVVMKGQGDIIGDVVPGEYTLLDLAAFSDLPPLIPRHAHVSGVRWEAARSGQSHGRVVFPPDFDGVLPVEVGTTELLRFYGCSLANSATVKVSLLYRHAIQDFTYENQYLEDFVTDPEKQAGSGLERHEFSHLDMPLGGGGGYLVLAKLEEGDMKLTAFSVPTHHCVYVPGGTIHTNDYFQGTWRTMLSDEAPVDHCHLTRSTGPDGQYEKLLFSFD